LLALSVCALMLGATLSACGARQGETQPQPATSSSESAGAEVEQMLDEYGWELEAADTFEDARDIIP
jgi:hypothetical protein